jgi:antitoxin HigA-1
VARAPIHPGEHLALELNELRMSAAELARQIDVPVNRITAILNGERGVTADTALRLGHWFGTTAEFWLNLQTLYELRVARQEVGDRVKKLPTLTSSKHKRESAPGRLSGEAGG